MRKTSVLFMTIAMVCPLFWARPAGAEPGQAGFAPELWDLANARVVEKFGRTCLSGIAFLKDSRFGDGVIEVDVYMLPDRRAYPGVLFRIQDGENYERVYLRPHRAPFYGDAVQYLPAFNGADSWQLYNGDGVTAAAAIPKGEWLTMKIEVQGTQARVFLGSNPQPVLEIFELQRGNGSGGLGLMSAMDGSAFFSNFRYRQEPGLRFTPVQPADVVPGMIRDWEMSQAFAYSQLDTEQYPAAALRERLQWRPIAAGTGGIVDFSRQLRRQGAEPETVLARTVIRAAAAGLKKYNFGYSDLVTVFLNGQPVFSGNSVYRSRESSFLGVVGSADSLYLPLRQGDNELLLMVTEVSGGWGFLFQDGTDVGQDGRLEKAWETEKTMAVPESAAWDPRRQVFYLSNYDGYNRSQDEGRQAITRVSPDGRVLEPRWLEGLFNPTGVAVHRDRLYAVERKAVAVIDIKKRKIIQRISLPSAVFPNDIVVDAAGILYVSDSGAHAVFRVIKQQAEAWLQGGEIASPNGLCLAGSELLVGNNGDRSLKAVDLASRRVRTVARFRSGVIDGLAVDGKGNILLSHNEGRLYRIDRAGVCQKLLDTTVIGTNLADFAFVAEKGLLVFPTFTVNSLLAYRLRSE